MRSRASSGSFPQAGAAAGTVLATAAFYVVALLPDDQFLAWGWRLPFLASAVLVVVGLYVRLRIAESPSFRRLELRKDTARLPLIETFRTHPRQVLLVAGAFLVQSAFAFIFIAYLATYATQIVGVSRDTILLIIALSGVVSFVMHLYFGALSDRFGRRPAYLTGVVAMGLLIFPSFALIDSGVFVLMLLGHMMIFGVAQAISGGATATMFAEMFSTGVRYTGASVGYQSRHVTTIDQKYDAVATYPSDPDYAEHDRVNRELYDEAYQIIKGLWENREFAMKGHHWQVPPDGIRWDHPATRAMAPSLVDDSGNLQKIGIAPNRTGRGFIAARPTRSVLPFTGVLPEELDSFPRIQLGGSVAQPCGAGQTTGPHMCPSLPVICSRTCPLPVQQHPRSSPTSCGRR